MPFPFKVLLLDIEGTIAPIDFVKKVLFPYAYEKAEAFLQKGVAAGDQQVSDMVGALLSTAAEEGKQDEEVRQGDALEDVVHNIQHWITKDKKLTALKTLQGHIWQQGYKKGDIKAIVYDDLLPILEHLKKQNVPVYIYSSGSVLAQQLLFRYSEKGDLTPVCLFKKEKIATTQYLAGYFDTKIGAKIDSRSYAAIAEEIQVPPADILFLTDVEAEAVAAREAGVPVKLVLRPGNAPLSEKAKSSFPLIENLNEFLALSQ